METAAALAANAKLSRFTPSLARANLAANLHLDGDVGDGEEGLSAGTGGGARVESEVVEPAQIVDEEY